MIDDISDNTIVATVKDALVRMNLFQMQRPVL